MDRQSQCVVAKEKSTGVSQARLSVLGRKKMDLVLNLPSIIRRYNLDRRGLQAELTAYLQATVNPHMSRHTVAKWLLGTAKAVRLNDLAGLCRWLVDQGVPAEELPGSLLSFVPAELWQAVAKMNRITLLLGQYNEEHGGSQPTRLWISRRDSEAANTIMSQLWELRDVRSRRLETRYVPFRYAAGEGYPRREFLDEDIRQARQIVDEALASGSHHALVLLGSAEVNFAVELRMAALFGVEPFPPSGQSTRQLPVYMMFRHQDPDMRSCFGGPGRPPGYTGPSRQGLYYRDAKDKWCCCAWEPGRQDAGLVVVVYNRAASSIEVILFGFTGRATAAMASHVIENAGPFWQPYCECSRGRLVGIYLCRLPLADADPNAASPDPQNYQAGPMEIIRLDASVIRRHVAPS